MKEQNKVDMADVCELAHILTVRECGYDNLPYEEEQENGDIRYPEKAQDIFDYYYDTITNTLNI